MDRADALRRVALPVSGRISTGQRPRLRRLRHCERPHEIAEVVGKSVELKAYRVGGEGAARQAGPFDRVLAFLDVLLAGAALVIEGDDALGRARQVSDDETDARVQFARMPFDLGHDVARLIPAPRPIAEAGEEAAYFLRRSPNRTLEQVSDLALQDGIGRQTACARS